MASDGKKMSSQMQAVVRLMTGQEERSIAQKLADSNRPTWEQYKKENEDKLNLDGMDQKKMEEYRAQLDKERDKILSRGKNNRSDSKKKKKKKRRHDDSDSDESRRRHRKKRKSKSRKKSKRNTSSDDSSSNDHTDYSSDDDSRRKRRKKKSKKKKKKSSKDDSDGNDSEGSHYRLSKFFDNDSEDD